ncbi:unnamed protein product [Polarella glacialis]|uniref:Uncharacterized protein n=1 Tax=Polarella glacialis TaxID=89957 RepID=A0A813GLY9_POLGL|nr:unnamed protein product [Polarella glacialis]
MSDSLKEHAVNAVQTAKMTGHLSDAEEMPRGIHASSQKQSPEVHTGVAHCSDSAFESKKDPATAICSDFDGVGGYSYFRIFCHLMGQHLQRKLERHEVVIDYEMDSQNHHMCVLQLPSLQGVRFSSGKAYPTRAFAKHRALVNALSALLQVPLPAPGSHRTPTSDLQALSMMDDGGSQSESGQSSLLPLLFGCMAQHMQRPPRSRDIAFTFLLDSEANYRCAVTLRALGGLQFSTKKTYLSKRNAKCATIMHACSVLIKAKTGYTRASTKNESLLLECMAKHMQRSPMEEDLDFCLNLDSNKAWQCVITLHALGDQQFSNPKPSTSKQNAKICAILYACKILSGNDAKFAKANKQDSHLLACLAKHMQRAPLNQDVEFRYVLYPNKLWRCVISFHALGGLEVSTPKLQGFRKNAKSLAISRACTILLQTNSEFANAKSKQESRLLACLAKHMLRAPVEADVEFRHALCSNNAWRCIITLKALGGLQFSTPIPQRYRHQAKAVAISNACAVLMTMETAGSVVLKTDAFYINANSKLESRLLACLAKHIHREPIAEDMELHYVMFSDNTWRCVITLTSLGGLQVSSLKPQKRKDNAFSGAISRACTFLMKTDSIVAEASSDQDLFPVAMPTCAHPALTR